MVDVIAVGRGCNQGAALESGSYSDSQFCESVVCIRETMVTPPCHVLFFTLHTQWLSRGTYFMA